MKTDYKQIIQFPTENCPVCGKRNPITHDFCIQLIQDSHDQLNVGLQRNYLLWNYQRGGPSRR